MLTLRLVGTFQSVAMVGEKLNAASFAQRDHSGQITSRTLYGNLTAGGEAKPKEAMSERACILRRLRQTAHS